MTYNIAGNRVNLDHLLRLLRQYRLDIVLLQEVSRPQHAQWLGEQLDLPHWHFAPTARGHYGVALLSRWPLGPSETLRFKDSFQGKLALAAPVATPAGALWVCSAHLDYPRAVRRSMSLWDVIAFARHELLSANRRYLEVQELRAWLLRLAPAPWVVGGDFNSFPFSRAHRYFSQVFADALTRRPWRYFTGTYRHRPFPCAIRIDFLYHSPAMGVIDARVVTPTVSDHWSILATFTSTATGQ
jgi:endonuclease/exonuclease/phosphatase family metal-dependent hydrolase